MLASRASTTLSPLSLSLFVYSLYLSLSLFTNRISQVCNLSPSFSIRGLVVPPFPSPRILHLITGISNCTPPPSPRLLVGRSLTRELTKYGSYFRFDTAIRRFEYLMKDNCKRTMIEVVGLLWSIFTS